MTTATLSLRARLDELHATYVDSINRALATGTDADVDRLAADYDDAATELVARFENKTHLLPLRRIDTSRKTRLRRR